MQFHPNTALFAKGIASSIHAARKRSGLTQAALAARSGVRTATVWQAENDPTHMQLDTLEKILGALGLQITLTARP